MLAPMHHANNYTTALYHPSPKELNWAITGYFDFKKGRKLQLNYPKQLVLHFLDFLKPNNYTVYTDYTQICSMYFCFYYCYYGSSVFCCLTAFPLVYSTHTYLSH